MMGGSEFRKKKLEALPPADVPRRHASKAEYIAAGKEYISRVEYTGQSNHL